MHRWIGSIFWFIIAVYTAIQAYRLGLGSLRHPGPGFIFFLAALFLIILNAVDLAGASIKKSKIEKREPPMWIGLRWQKILLVLGSLSAYAFSLNLAGFLLPTFLLMVFLYKGVEPTKWWLAIVSSLITVLLSYVIFKVLLDVQ